MKVRESRRSIHDEKMEGRVHKKQNDDKTQTKPTKYEQHEPIKNIRKREKDTLPFEIFRNDQSACDNDCSILL